MMVKIPSYGLTLKSNKNKNRRITVFLMLNFALCSPSLMLGLKIKHVSNEVRYENQKLLLVWFFCPIF